MAPLRCPLPCAPCALDGGELGAGAGGRRRAIPGLSRTVTGLALAMMAGLTSGCARTPSGDCPGFVPTTVEAMRRAGASGCFELRDVVVEGRTASPTAPRIFATDAEAGAFSAIMAKCSPTSEPHCSEGTRALVGQVLRGAVVTLRGYYWQDADTGFEELALQELEDPSILAEPPAPQPISASELARGARTPSAWFHYVALTLPSAAPWGVFDMSPRELVADTCPRVSGFALAPRVATQGPPPGCDGLVSPPPGPSEGAAVLVGRAFFHDFSWSSDCACAEAHSQRLLAEDATFEGELRGILTFSMPTGGASGWQILEPLSNADLPLVSP